MQMFWLGFASSRGSRSCPKKNGADILPSTCRWQALCSCFLTHHPTNSPHLLGYVLQVFPRGNPIYARLNTQLKVTAQKQQSEDSTPGSLDFKTDAFPTVAAHADEDHPTQGLVYFSKCQVPHMSSKSSYKTDASFFKLLGSVPSFDEGKCSLLIFLLFQ